MQREHVKGRQAVLQVDLNVWKSIRVRFLPPLGEKFRHLIVSTEAIKQSDTNLMSDCNHDLTGALLRVPRRQDGKNFPN